MDGMKISMGKNEQDIFFLFIDLDGQNKIKYQEFLRILKRAGLQSVSSDEKLIYMIYNSIKRQGMSLMEAFKAFDSN